MKLQGFSVLSKVPALMAWRHISCQAGMLDFAAWIDNFAPADGTPGAERQKITA